MEKQKTALVLGGGGSKGALQAGFYRAVREAGIQIDLVVGSSIGALNGAFIAAGTAPRVLVNQWIQLRRRTLLSLNWELLRRGAAAESIYTFKSLRRFLEERLPVRRFEDLQTPFSVVTTDLQTGRPYIWEEGDLLEAILASCAIPGIFPPVRGPEGRWLMDGALADNIPVGAALERSADRAVGILCRAGSERRDESHGIARMLGRAFGIATDLKWYLEAPRYERHPGILIIDPVHDVQVDSLDFTRGAELARAGYQSSRQVVSLWLEDMERRGDPRLIA